MREHGGNRTLGRPPRRRLGTNPLYDPCAICPFHIRATRRKWDSNPRDAERPSVFETDTLNRTQSFLHLKNALPTGLEPAECQLERLVALPFAYDSILRKRGRSGDRTQPHQSCKDQSPPRNMCAQKIKNSQTPTYSRKRRDSRI